MDYPKEKEEYLESEHVTLKSVLCLYYLSRNIPKHLCTEVSHSRGTAAVREHNPVRSSLISLQDVMMHRREPSTSSERHEVPSRARGETLGEQSWE